MEGELFNLGDWSDSPPGEAAYHYSNAGFTLLGYLVEQIAGQPFNVFTRNRIFGPLRMDTAAWHMAAIPNHERQDVANVYR
jgi:CubicO group peptidase (beta-lactamase class C family)